MTKIILDLFGGTGAWGKPYAATGYTVHNITLPAYDVCRTMLFESRGEPTIIFQGLEAELKIKSADVYGVLAAPPCTEFSHAKTCRGCTPDFTGGLRNVRAALDIIWFCMQNWPKSLTFWALENPYARLRYFLGEPPLVFSPWEYGDGWSKKTAVWGYFKPPRKTHRQPPLNWNRGTQEDSVMPPLPADYVPPPGWSRRAARRSMTPPGFARAFFKANQ